MNHKQQKSEGGQVLIILVLVFIALLGFTALAVDGSMVYSDRRHAQNTSDIAALAGATRIGRSLEENYISYYDFTCNKLSSTIEAAAKEEARQRAAANGYAITKLSDSSVDAKTQNYVTVTCVNNKTRFEKGAFVQVGITGNTPTAFAQYVYQGPLVYTVDSIAAANPRVRSGYNYTIVALNSKGTGCGTPNGGVAIAGTGELVIKGGGIFSNSCVYGNGQGKATIDGDMGYRTTVTANGNNVPDNFKPWPPTKYEVDLPPDSYDFDGACESSDPDVNVYNIDAKDFPEKLDPGLWCIDGNLSINAKQKVEGHGVTLYMKNGKLTINGGALVNLTAREPTGAVCGAEEGFAGIVIYAPKTNSNPIQLSGGGGSYFEGIVYAPAADITVIGNQDSVGYKTQLIGYNVQTSGTGYLELNLYDKCTIKQSWIDLTD